MYRTFHLQHQQPAQKAMGALGITLRILKNLKPDPFCLFFLGVGKNALRRTGEGISNKINPVREFLRKTIKIC
jgi:hypothetical protein